MAKLLSIEIDNCVVKIIEADKKGESLSICRCMAVNTNHGVKDGKIADMNLVVNKISETLKYNNIKTKKAAFIINSSSIMIRTIKLPLLKKSSEILSMIQIELQQMISADLTNFKIIYKVSNIINENRISYADYLVYCVPITLVNQYTDLAKKLNLKLIKIDILPTCINALYKNNIKVNDTYLNIREISAFINVRENFISFSVANNGFCNFYISTEIEAPYIEKVAEPQHMYFCADNYSNADNTIISQITKFMRYYYAVSGNKVIDKIYINGACSLKTIIDIKNRLNRDIEIISSISCLTVDEKISSIFELNKYFNAVLTLFSYNKDINLNTAKKKNINKYGYAVISVVILIVSICLFGLINSQLGMKNEIQAMTSYIDNGSNNEINNKIDNIKKETDYLEQYLKSAEKLQQIINDNDYVDSIILRKINMAKPSETKVASIHCDKNSTQLQCVSTTMSEVTLYFSNLREIELIDSVYIPAIQSKTGQEFSYSVVLKLKDVIEDDN